MKRKENSTSLKCDNKSLFSSFLFLYSLRQQLRAQQQCVETEYNLTRTPKKEHKGYDHQAMNSWLDSNKLTQQQADTATSRYGSSADCRDSIRCSRVGKHSTFGERAARLDWVAAQPAESQSHAAGSGNTVPLLLLCDCGQARQCHTGLQRSSNLLHKHCRHMRGFLFLFFPPWLAVFCFRKRFLSCEAFYCYWLKHCNLSLSHMSIAFMCIFRWTGSTLPFVCIYLMTASYIIGFQQVPLTQPFKEVV